MLSLQITDIRKMSQLLFTEDSFDRFLLHDAAFVTEITTTVEGRKNNDFYTDDEKEREAENAYITYGRIRPVCFSLIKGKRLPLSFKLILLTDRASTEAIRKKAGFTDCAITSMSINLLYKDQILYLTTGISYNGFSMDRSAEKAWDEAVEHFLNQKEIRYETV